VKTAPQWVIEEEVYIEHEGFEKSRMCAGLKRALYGLKTSTSCLVHTDRQLFHRTWILQE
jgi:hypothetical protein